MTETLSEYQQMNAVSEISRWAQIAFDNITWELTKPHVVHRVIPVPDGNKWCCLLGDDLQVGIAGFGDTPAEAAKAFDKAWHEANTPAATLKKKGKQDDQ